MSGLTCTHYETAVTTSFTLYDTVSLVCGDTTGTTFCGARSFEILDSSGDAITDELLTWALSADVVTITAHATLESLVGTHLFQLRATLTDHTPLVYPDTEYVNAAFPVYVLAHACSATVLDPITSDVST